MPYSHDELMGALWVDSPEILDDHSAYRRLIPQWVTYDKYKGRFRVNSGAFPPHRESSAISVTLEQIADELGMNGQDLSLYGHESTHGLVAIEVGKARSLGFKVRLAPTNDNPAHAMLFAEDLETGVCPDRRRCKLLGRRLALHAELLILPPGCQQAAEAG